MRESKEDWPAQIRKTDLFMAVAAVAVAACPVIMVIIWALSR